MANLMLGRDGQTIFPLALGGNVFGWTADEATSFAVLDAFVEAGGNLIDTADVYSRWVPGNHGGESETIIGKWFQRSGKRSLVMIATKVGGDMGAGRKGLSKSNILQAAEDSLRRLRTDCIDLYQAHYDDPESSLEETLDAFDQLIRQGKVLAIGASNYSSKRLARALDVSRQNGCARYESLQTEYNLYDRSEFEMNLEPLCLKEGLGVLAYFSLAAGFLTGKYRSAADLVGRARSQYVEKYLNDRGFRILQALDEESRRLGATPAQVALAWLGARPSITAPIASATSVQQLGELMAATTLQLDDQSIQRLSEASALPLGIFAGGIS